MSDICDYLTDSEISDMMKRIKTNVIKREKELSGPQMHHSDLPDDQNFSGMFEQDLSFLHQNYSIQNDAYVIKSHRPFFGSFLVKGRELVHGEVKRYTGSMFFRQSLFNGTLVRIISEIKKALTQNRDRIGQVETALAQERCRINEAEKSITQNLDKIGLFETALSQHQDNIKQVASSLTQNLSKMDRIIKDQVSENQRERDQIKSEIMRAIDERFLKQGDMTRWGILYSKDILEKDLADNIEYHTHFIRQIRKYAKLSAQTKIPKLIEIGLGNGTMSIFFSRDELYDVYGIDNDIDIVRYCISNNKKLGGYVKFILMDAFDLNLLNRKQFDVAFSQGTMEHFDNESIVKLLSRQLEIARYVIFSIPSVNWATREIGNERKMTLEEWRTLLQDGGFNIVNLEYYKEDLHILGVIS